jgi:hypothetical protein
MVVHTCNPRIWEAEIVSSKPLWSIKKDPVSKTILPKIRKRKHRWKEGKLYMGNSI